MDVPIDVKSFEVLVHLIHAFHIVSDFLVQPSLLLYLLRLVISSQSAHELVFPIPPFFQGFETLLEDADFNVCFEVVFTCVYVFRKVVIAGPRF